MKILWHSVPSVYKTGYGTQTRVWTNRIKRDHQVAISSIIGGMPSYTNEDDIPTLGCGPRMCWGNDFIRKHCEIYKPDILITMSDTFVYDTAKLGHLPWIGWIIIDSSPLLPALQRSARACQHCIAESRFGQETLKRAGIASTYIPHAIDTVNDFFPEDRGICRDRLSKWMNVKIGDRMFITMNSANMSRPSRKNFYAAFTAFKLLLKKRPDALLYCHTESSGMLQGGENLGDTARLVGLTPDNLLFCDQYDYIMGAFKNDYMRTVYSASDVMLNASIGEGFGIPIIEAYACGCRVIAPAVSSMLELVDPQDQVKAGLWVSQMPGGRQFSVSPHALTERMLCDERRSIEDYVSIAKQYDIEKVYTEKFMPLINRIKEGEICLHHDDYQAESGIPAPEESLLETPDMIPKTIVNGIVTDSIPSELACAE